MKLVLTLLTLLSTTVASLAQFGQFASAHGQRVEAKRIAPMRLMVVNGETVPVQTGPWIEVANAVGPAAAQDVACDLFEYSLDGAGLIVPNENGAYGAGCGLASTDVRWMYNPMKRTTMVYNDMKLAPNMAGTVGKRVGLSWFQGATETLQVAVSTTENWVTAGDPNSAGLRGDYPGVLIDFGSVIATPTLTYVWADTDISSLPIKMPDDGSGGYILMFRTANNTAFSTMNAPTFWGAKAGNPASPQDAFEYQTLTSNNGTFVLNADKVNLAAGLCPDPLASMVVFLTDAPSVIPPTAQSLILGKVTAGNLASLAADDNNAETVCQFILPNAASPFLRMDFTATAPASSASIFRLKVKSRMVLGGVFQQTMYLFDHTANAFNTSRVDTINTTYATRELTGTAPLSKYVQAGTLQVRCRLEVKQTGFSAVSIPCTNLELLNWVIAP